MLVQWWPWLLALVPFFLLAARHWGEGPGPVIADYAQYLAHARALAEGRPYTDTGYIFTGLYPYAGPMAQAPGLPLMLAALYVVFGQSEVVAKLALVLAGAGLAVLAGRAFAARWGLPLGMAVTLLVSLAPDVTRLSSVPLSDLPFAALVWSVVLLYDRPGPFTLSRLLAITLLGAAAVSVRSFGVALVPAVLLFALANRREHGLSPAVPVALWLALFFAANLLFPITVGFRPTAAWLEELPRTVTNHVLSYRYSLFAAHLYPAPVGAINDVYHVASALVGAAGMVAWARAAWRSFAALFGAGYVAMLLIVPVLDLRYMWPVYPLLAFGLVNGLSLVLGRFGRLARPQRAALLAAVALSLGAFLTDLRAPRQVSFADREEVREVFGVLRRTHAASPARVAFVRPQILALEAGVPSMTIFSGPDSVVVRELNRKCITHVVLGDLGLAPKADSAFRQVVLARPASFALEFRNQSFEVYRFAELDCPRRRGDAPRERP